MLILRNIKPEKTCQVRRLRKRRTDLISFNVLLISPAFGVFISLFKNKQISAENKKIKSFYDSPVQPQLISAKSLLWSS